MKHKCAYEWTCKSEGIIREKSFCKRKAVRSPEYKNQKSGMELRTWSGAMKKEEKR